MHKKTLSSRGDFGKSEGQAGEKGGLSRKCEQIVTIQEQKSFGQNGESKQKYFFWRSGNKAPFLARAEKNTPRDPTRRVSWFYHGGRGLTPPAWEPCG